MNIKTTFIGAIIATVMMSGASQAATFLQGNFALEIGNFNAGGSAGNAQANEATLIEEYEATGFYNGALDFNIGAGNSASTTIGDFLNSGSGTFTGFDQAVLDLTLSTPTFQDTTIFSFVANFADGFSGSVLHDDGVSVLDDGTVVAASTAPTIAITTGFGFDGGDFNLIYVAANGNPSILEVEVSPVPVPAALPLFLAGFGGLGLMARRKRKAA